MTHLKSGLTYLELRDELKLLSAAFVGGHIQKVRDPDPRSVALKIRVPGQTYFLILSGDPQGASLEVSLTQPSTLPEPTGIGRWVRAHLIGQRIESLALDPHDRIVTLMTARGGVCLELLPHAPNLYTLTADQRVMGWSKRIPSRGLRLGQPWTPPERPEHLILSTDPDLDQTPEAAPLLRDDALQILAARFGALVPEAQDTDQDIVPEARERRRLFKQTRARLKRLHTTLSQDLSRIEHAQRWREEGELLKGNLGALKRGMTQITVTDWYDPEMGERVIELDPKLDGFENAELLFKRHRKAARGAEITGERLAEVERQQALFEEVCERLSDSPLDEVKRELAEIGVYRAKQQPRRDTGSQERLPYRIFWSAHGEKLWLGRGGMDNHRTTFQSARGQDLWVHTRDVPGAHVIIPRAHRNHTPQHETVLDAAALAVHHSKQRDEEAVALYFTERKHIRPIPGAPPGKVMVSSSKTIIAEDVALRIERLYAEVKRREASGSS